MEVAAKLQMVRISPQKMGQVADIVRGLKAGDAMNVLLHTQKKAARLLRKLLGSAIANAEHNFSLDIDELKVLRILVGRGPFFKRMQPRAKGRGYRITKRTAQITIVVSDT